MTSWQVNHPSPEAPSTPKKWSRYYRCSGWACSQKIMCFFQSWGNRCANRFPIDQTLWQCIDWQIFLIQMISSKYSPGLYRPCLLLFLLIRVRDWHQLSHPPAFHNLKWSLFRYCNFHLYTKLSPTSSSGLQPWSTATVKSCDNELWGHPNWLKDVMQKVADESWIHTYPHHFVSICHFVNLVSVQLRFFQIFPPSSLAAWSGYAWGLERRRLQRWRTGASEWPWVTLGERLAARSARKWQVVASRGTWQVTRLHISSLDGNYPQHYQHSRSTSCTQHTQHISAHNQHLPKVSKLGLDRLDLVWIRFLGGDSAIGPTRRLRSCLKTNCLRRQGLPMFPYRPVGVR